MTGTIISLRSRNDLVDAAYPQVSKSGARWPVVLDRQDGEPATVVARGLALAVGANQSTVLALKDLRIDVLITDSRIIFSAKHYDKGGGWWGIGGAGAAFAALANSVSKAAAASRSRGKALVGHIGYGQWLQLGWSGNGKQQGHLRFATCDPADPVVTQIVDLTLDKGLSVSRITDEICRRAAAARLANPNTRVAPATPISVDLMKGLTPCYLDGHVGAEDSGGQPC